MNDDFLVKQVEGYGLGNFIMLTPTIKRLSEIYGKKINVYFHDEFVKNCFLDCDFINIVDTEYKTPNLTSGEVNKKIPDYKNIFKKIINEKWDPKYHTYVDNVNEISKKEEKYILFLNGLANVSSTSGFEKSHWWGKKEIDEETFHFIKKNTNLPIYFTGSQNDITNHPWIEKLCDKVYVDDIRNSLALIRDAEKIISNDTGLSHCSGALNKDILILWKDTPFIKNTNPGKKTVYSKKENWRNDLKLFLDGKVRYSNVEDKKYVYILPSYERFDKVIELIEDIMKVNPECLIFLINDGSNDDSYGLLENYDSRLIYLQNEKNLGKKGYWKTVNTLFKEISKYDFTYCVMLNDDLTLTYDFKIVLDNNSTKKKILRLFTPTTLLDKKNWGFENWIDGIFCVPKIFLNLINYTVDEINLPDNTLVSSGVGRQLTQKLNKFNIKVDFVGSIVEHNGNEDSKMHPILRKKEPLIGKIENSKLESKDVIKIVEPPKEIIIKKTLEKTNKTIDYSKINQAFNNNTSSKLKTNITQTPRKGSNVNTISKLFPQNKKRR
jgi:hypothetical protein